MFCHGYYTYHHQLVHVALLRQYLAWYLFWAYFEKQDGCHSLAKSLQIAETEALGIGVKMAAMDFFVDFLYDMFIIITLLLENKMVAIIV